MALELFCWLAPRIPLLKAAVVRRALRSNGDLQTPLLSSELSKPMHRLIGQEALSLRLVSVREEVESYESFMIQERWPDSEGPPMWTNENRARYDRSHLRYPSDLTDDEWQLVEPLIPPGRRGGDKRTVIMREVVNGLMYILSTGCQWRAIPKDLPPRSTLYDYFDLWSWDRTLDLIHHELYVKCREAIGREASPTAAVIDSQSVKSAEKGGLRLIRRATTQERRSRARSGIFSSIRKAC